ncbi:MAG: CGGC domain-containing protein [Deltaproteobacteria bacterium]|nr:CGGC domain-containing protein [Deltaproteobacteria bacterium]
MKNIGIINCFEVSKRCSASGCLKALHARTGSFEQYAGEEVVLLSFAHCNGCGEDAVEQVVARAKRMREVGVEVIHLSTCTRSRCGQYEAFLEALEPMIEVVGYTHAKRGEAGPVATSQAVELGQRDFESGSLAAEKLRAPGQVVLRQRDAVQRVVGQLTEATHREVVDAVIGRLRGDSE